MPKYIIYDGKLTEEQDFKISVRDRAFNYGDGLFETLVVKDRKVMFLQDHMDRLLSGFELLSFAKEGFPKVSILQKYIDTLLSTNELQQARVKIMVWRHEGGLFLPTNQQVHFLIQCSPTTAPISEKEKVVTAPYYLQEKSGLSSIKSLNSGVYILSSLYYQSQNAQDALLLNSQGEVAELCAANLFFYKGNDFYTPHLQSGCLPGIMRKQVLKTLRSLKKNIAETAITPKDLGKFDGCFGSNVRGLFSIKHIDDHTYTQGLDLSKLEDEIYR